MSSRSTLAIGTPRCGPPFYMASEETLRIRIGRVHEIPLHAPGKEGLGDVLHVRVELLPASSEHRILSSRDIRHEHV